MKIVMLPAKIPFDFSLFFGAVKNLLGEETKKENRIQSGHYDYIWEVTEENSRRIQECAGHIQRWMKYFDITFPESRCDIAVWNDSLCDGKQCLRITIHHKMGNHEE